LVFNPVEHQANKHIRIADHYARELTKEGVIAPHRVASELNKADCFTKPLQSTNFKRASAWIVGDGLIAQESVCMFSAKDVGTDDVRPIPILACRRCLTASTPSSIQFQCLHCSSCEFQWTCTCSKPSRPMTPDGDRLRPRPSNTWLEEMSAKIYLRRFTPCDFLHARQCARRSLQMDVKALAKITRARREAC